MSQSTKAHRLSRKAYKQGGQKLQIPVLRALYKAHLEFEKDIADYDVLGDIAEAEGVMSKDKVDAYHVFSMSPLTMFH
jgi:predicted DsbA family dithiol-disulfide isomerase